MLYTFAILLSVPVTVISLLACALYTADFLRLYGAARSQRRAAEDLTFVQDCCGHGACVRARQTVPA